MGFRFNGTTYEPRINGSLAEARINGETVYDPTETVYFEEQTTDVVIAPDGDDSTGDGSYDAPYFSLDEAFDVVNPGERIVCRGGVYDYDFQQRISGKDGTETDPITVREYGGHEPIFDFASGTDLDYGVDLYGCDWWHLRGFTIRNVPHSDEYGGDGFRLWGGSANTVVENIECHDNNHHGIEFVDTVDCTLRDSSSHGHTASPGSTDGMQVRGGCDGLVVEYCEFYDNIDDGIDFFNANEGDSATVRYCVAYDNGIQPGEEGWHAAFKMGGPDVDTGGHVVENCLAWNNSRGFAENTADLPVTFHNCTAYDNVEVDFHANNTPSTGSHELRNCISVTNDVLVDSANDIDYCTFDENGNEVIAEADMDIISLDSADFDWWTGGTFLHLDSTSSCLEAGTDVGLRYSGTSPDLGAFDRGFYTIDRPTDTFIEVDSTELDEPDGAAIGLWPDVSGNNRDMVATSGDEPTFEYDAQNGLPALYFDGTQSVHAGPWTNESQPNTLVGVVASIGDSDPIWDATGENDVTERHWLDRNTGTEPYHWRMWAGDNFEFGQESDYRTPEFHVVSCIYDEGNSAARINGVDMGTWNPGDNQWGGLQFAQSYNTTGGGRHEMYMAEFHGFTRRVDGRELAALEGDLLDKWRTDP